MLVNKRKSLSVNAVRTIFANRRNLETFITKSSDCIIILDVNGVVSEFNPAAEKHLEISRETAMSTDFVDLCNHVKNKLDIQFSAKAALEAETMTFTSVLIRKKRLDLTWVSETLYDLQNKKNGLMLIGTPVREASKYFDSLADAFDEISAVVSQSPANIYWCDTDWNLLGCSDHQAKCFGINDRYTIYQKTLFDIFKQLPEVITNSHRAIEENRTITVEEPGFLPNGKMGTYLSQKSPIIDEGKIVGLICTSLDITSLKKKESLLLEKQKQAEATLANLIALMPGHVYWLNKKSILLGCNDRQAQSLGFQNAEEVIGKNLMSLLDKEQAKIIKEINDNVMASDVPVTTEETATFEGGSPKFYLSQKAPLKDLNNNTIGVIGVSMDITARKEAEATLADAKEKAESASRAKTEFIANISHDLRTPLHTVLGMGELLQLKEHPKYQDDIIDSLTHSSRTLLNLVEDILSFAKLEAGEYKTHNATFDLHALVEKLISDIIPIAKKKNLNVVLNYDDSIPRKIVSDTKIVNRILSNLISNAVKFTDDGFIIITVECAKKTKRKAMLQIHVEDSGIGIPKNDLPMIFDRFYRVNPSYKGQYKGSGLGLAIVKQLCEQINAKVDANSELGKGSTFCFSFETKLDRKAQLQESFKQQFSQYPMLIIEKDDVQSAMLQQKFSLENMKAVNINDFNKLDANSLPAYHIIFLGESLDHKKIIKRFGKTNKPMFIEHTDHPGKKCTECDDAIDKALYGTELYQAVSDMWQRWQKYQERQKRRAAPRILLVEDEFMIQKLTVKLLEELRCVVDVANCGKKALQLIENSYDLIFMDIGLPDIDGIEVTKRIRKKLKTHVPIVALTAHANEAEKKKCFEVGMDEFLQKPATIADFQSMLAEFALISSASGIRTSSV